MNQKRKIPFEILDSIRGIASLYVAIAHCRGTLWIGGSEFMKKFPRNTWDIQDYFVFGSSLLTRLAVEFVIVFFVLSGFSIAHSLSSNKSPLEFYKRRFIRIYPSYVLALVWAGLVFALTRYWHPQWYDGSLTQFAFSRTMEMNNYFEPGVMIRNLFYLPGQGFVTPLWSLTYEVMFYLLAPFLLRKINLYVLISLLLFLVNLIFPEMVLALDLPRPVFEFVFVYNIYFAVGVYLYANFETVSGWFREYTKTEFLLIFGGFLAFMYGANLFFQIETDFTFIEAAMLSAVLIVFFLKFEFRIPWLMKVGEFSYSLYISHFASIFLYLGIYWLIVKPGTPHIYSYWVWMPAVLFVALIAWLQYQLIEKRTKNILNIIRKRQRPVISNEPGNK